MAVTTPTAAEQIADILRAAPTVTAIVGENIYTQPLKRPGSVDETPDAFEPTGTRWLLPSIVIAPRIDRRARQAHNTAHQNDRFATWVATLALYGPPTQDGERTIAELAAVCIRVLRRRPIQLPDNVRGRIVIPHNGTGVVESPDFPGAGLVAYEQLEIAGVWRRQ